MKFRPDINGLRAIAVLPVLFFHAGVPWFSGGYLGVDVFFVISGFLITGILAADIQEGIYSPARFYEKRLRRIMPVMLLVALCTSALSFFFMVPYSLKNYGQSLVATMLSANNVLLYLTSGYWSLAAEFKPLYHTWSLAVEEQYYLVAPALIYLLLFRLRLGKRSTLGVLLGLLGLSLWYSISLYNAEFRFLMIFSRAWELLLGAVLALLPEEKKNGRAGWTALGLVAILAAYVLPSGTEAASLVSQLAAALGAALVIRYSNGSHAVGQLLSIRPLAFMGLISYSAYLWHQPLLAFVRLSSEQAPHYLKLLAAALLAIPLAYLSWRYVENTLRNPARFSSRKFYAVTGIGLTLNLALGVLFYKTYGLQQLAPQFSYGVNPQAYVDAPRAFVRAEFRNDGRKKLLVMGSSFARDYINILQEEKSAEAFDLVYWEGECRTSSPEKLASLLKHSDLVVYTSNWGQAGFQAAEIAGVESCFKHIQALAGGEAYVLGVKNFGWNNDFVKVSLRPPEAIKTQPLEGVIRSEQAMRGLFGSKYLSIMDLVMDPNGLVPVFTDSGRFITYDTNHLTQAGAQFIGQRLFARHGFLLDKSWTSQTASGG
ncbi:acyltransferase family protein [Azohydromonas lata]|uniref:Acyltransferase n=1 Tax=Azohydromonas lata TaxID=45677 RepID=A0ABU5ICH9_9BURK|nr:acyltransferase [Azohydromonas lata]MDZ5456519.1 acyltransferase [Azohydromonas lata]